MKTIRDSDVRENEKDRRREHFWRCHWPVELSSKRCWPGFSTASAEHAAPHAPHTAADPGVRVWTWGDVGGGRKLSDGEVVLKMVHCFSAFDSQNGDSCWPNPMASVFGLYRNPLKAPFTC